MSLLPPRLAPSFIFAIGLLVGVAGCGKLQDDDVVLQDPPAQAASAPAADPCNGIVTSADICRAYKPEPGTYLRALVETTDRFRQSAATVGDNCRKIGAALGVTAPAAAPGAACQQVADALKERNAAPLSVHAEQSPPCAQTHTRENCPGGPPLASGIACEVGPAHVDGAAFGAESTIEQALPPILAAFGEWHGLGLELIVNASYMGPVQEGLPPDQARCTDNLVFYANGTAVGFNNDLTAAQAAILEAFKVIS